MAIEIGIQQLSAQFALGLQQITNTLKQELNVISNTLVQEISVVNHLRQNVEVTRNTLLSSNQAHYTYIETLNQVQDKAAQVEGSSSRIGGAISQVASKLFDFVGSSLDSLKDLKAGPDALGAVTDEQAQSAKDYQTSMEKLDKVLDGVKTRVGLGLAPQLSFLADRFLAVVDANKELITEGLQKTMTLVAESLDAVYNFGRALDFVVSGTVGWDNALMMLGSALLWVGRASLMAFATNPIMWIIAALVVVIALVDDFMTYLDGGESAFGGVWEPLVKGFKEVGAILADMKAQFDAFWAENGETVMAFAEGLMVVIGASISNLLNLFKGFFALLRGDFDGVKEAFSGWFEGVTAQFEVLSAGFKKVAGMLGFGDDKEGEAKQAANALAAGSAPEAGKESPGMFSGVAGFFGWNSADDQAATAPRLVEGASQLTAGVQEAQSRAAHGAGVGAASLAAPVSNNSFNQSVTVHVSGDNPQAIGREVAEQVASNQQRLATHNNQSDIRQ